MKPGNHNAFMETSKHMVSLRAGPLYQAPATTAGGGFNFLLVLPCIAWDMAGHSLTELETVPKHSLHRNKTWQCTAGQSYILAEHFLQNHLQDQSSTTRKLVTSR
jgi:hypothetical protein